MGAEVGGVPVCLARVDGTLRALGGVCPHRGAPMEEGWVEDGKVVCPWHSWEFDPATGEATYPVGERVAVYGVKEEDGAVLIALGEG